MEIDNRTSNSSTASGLDMAFKHMQAFSLVLYCVIFVVGTVGNGLVIYVTGFKMKKTVHSLWFLNLALADFLFTAFLVFSAVSLSQQQHWPFGLFMCKLNNFVSLVNMFASAFFLTTISLDRCLCVLAVVWAQNNRTVRKAQMLGAAIWLAAGICSAPYASFRTVMDRNNKTSCRYPPTMNKDQLLSLYIFRFLMGFLIPFLAMLFSYVAISIRFRRLQNRRKTLSHRIIVFIFLGFFICWLPFHVLSFMEIPFSDNKTVEIGGPLSVSLAFSNSCLNPIVYVFIRADFRSKLRESLCLVLEHALVEDHLPIASSHFLSPSFSRVAEKSESSTRF